LAYSTRCVTSLSNGLALTSEYFHPHPNPPQLTTEIACISLYRFIAFSAVFKGDIITRSDADYEDSISRFAANAVRRARIVAHVKDADDVARAIAYARMEGLPVAVRGGGYSITGASSVEDGLVVDLSRYMNSVKVDVKNGLAFVGAGATWRDVDRETLKYGLATVGGSVNQV
jgi:FAD/FMN-containing dehydrogenase